MHFVPQLGSPSGPKGVLSRLEVRSAQHQISNRDSAEWFPEAPRRLRGATFAGVPRRVLREIEGGGGAEGRVGESVAWFPRDEGDGMGRRGAEEWGGKGNC